MRVALTRAAGRQRIEDGVLLEKENRERSGSSTLSQPPNIAVNLTAASPRSAPAGYRRRWADQSELATTMMTQAVIVGRAGGLLTGDGRS
jgi:hypothetical protein